MPELPAPSDRYVLTLSCPDRVGIVHAVSGLLAEHHWNITESQQFGDRSTGQFFMRVAVDRDEEGSDPAAVGDALGVLAAAFSMSLGWHDAGARARTLVLVSKQGHCLNDLLYRYRIGAIPVEISAICSNHPDFGPLAASYGIDFHHLPVTPETKPAQEAALLALVDELEIELVVLARYMQILSPELARALEGRAINIHHGLLPAFKGAQPYRQAWERGVKVIGATAHYVTDELDEGPIIEQVVHAVDHSMGPDALAALGRDLECQALARAVSWHVERRVFLNGSRTVVFR